MTKIQCFECGSTKNIHMHHVVPKILGGTRTLPLCADCHSKAHNSTLNVLAKIQKNNKAKLGKFAGGKPPYGYKLKNSDTLVIEKNEACNVKGIFNERINGKTLRKIGEMFNLPHSSVKYILENKSYTGVYRQGKHTVKIEPIIDNATFLKANTRHGI